MTVSARTLLRRALAVTGKSSEGATAIFNRSRTKQTPIVNIPTETASMKRTITNTTQQHFSSAPAKKVAQNASPALQKYEKLVEESIKKLVTSNREDKKEEQIKPISNEDLEVRLKYFQKIFDEAELCLSDLRETLFEVDDEQYLEECSCAEGALNNAFTAYIDLLEDFRRSTDEQLQAYSEERNTNANELKRLRKELDQIIEVANNRDRAST